MSELPEITDVQRLELKPGDSLVIRLAQEHVSPDVVDRIVGRVRAILHLDESVPVLVLPSGISVEVASMEDAVRLARENPGHIIRVTDAPA